MITKSKLVVLMIFFVIAGLITWYVAAGHIERARIATDRITLTYGTLFVGVGTGDSPYGITHTDFNEAMVMEIAARLNMRPVFFYFLWDRIFDQFDAHRFDIIPSVTITQELKAAYNFSNPYLAIPSYGAQPDLFGIILQKGNDRLTEAINRVLEDMFNDGTALRLSLNFFGMDLVTQARQAW